MSGRAPAVPPASNLAAATGRAKSRNHSETEAESHVNECGEAEFEQLLATAARPRYRTSSAHTQHNQSQTISESVAGSERTGGAHNTGTGAPLTRRSLQVLNRLFHAADTETEQADFLAQRAGVTRPALSSTMPIPVQRSGDTVVQVDDAMAFPFPPTYTAAASEHVHGACTDPAGHKGESGHCDCHSASCTDRSGQHAAVSAPAEDVPFIDENADLVVEDDNDCGRSPARTERNNDATAAAAFANNTSSFSNNVFPGDMNQAPYSSIQIPGRRIIPRQPANSEVELQPMNSKERSPEDYTTPSRASLLEQGKAYYGALPHPNTNSGAPTLLRHHRFAEDTVMPSQPPLSLSQINGSSATPGRHYGSNRAYTQRGHRPAKPTKRAAVRKEKNVRESIKAENIDGHMGDKALEEILRSLGVHEDSVKVTKVAKKPGAVRTKKTGRPKRRAAGDNDNSTSGSSSPEPHDGGESYTGSSSGAAAEEADDARSAASAPVFPAAAAVPPRDIQPVAATLDLDDARLYMPDNELPPDLLQPAAPAPSANRPAAQTPTDFIPVVHARRTRKHYRLGGRHSYDQAAGQTSHQLHRGSDSDAAGPLVSPPQHSSAAARPPPARRRNSSGGEHRAKGDAARYKRKQRVPSKPPSEPCLEPAERRASDVGALCAGGGAAEQRQRGQVTAALHGHQLQAASARSGSSASMPSRPSYSSMAATGKVKQDAQQPAAQQTQSPRGESQCAEGALSPRSTASADSGLMASCSSVAQLQSSSSTQPVRIAAAATQDDQCKYSSSPNLTSDDFPPPPSAEVDEEQAAVVAAHQNASGPSWATVAASKLAKPKAACQMQVHLGGALPLDERTLSDGEKTPTAVHPPQALEAAVSPQHVMSALVDAERDGQHAADATPLAAHTECDAALSLVTCSDGAASVTLGAAAAERNVPTVSTPIVEFAHEEDLPLGPSDDAPYEFGWDPSMPTAPSDELESAADLQRTPVRQQQPPPQWLGVTPPPTPTAGDSCVNQMDEDSDRHSPAAGIIRWKPDGGFQVSAPADAPLPVMPSGSSVSVADAMTGAVATNFAAVHVSETHLHAARFLYSHWDRFITMGEQFLNQIATQRLQREFKEVITAKEEALAGVRLEVIGDSLAHLCGTIAGPPDTPYAGGEFRLDIVIPPSYPFQPPKCRFITRIWHPNISSQTGAICLDILKDQWAASMTLRTVLLSIQALLQCPQPDDPQDAVVAKQALAQPEIFRRTARFWAQHFAQAPGNKCPEMAGKLQQLFEMGVTKDVALAALSNCGWDVARATEDLFS